MGLGWEDFALRKIEEAMEDGRFDNLEGKGKPLRFDDDPAVPSHMKLGQQILRNANMRPEVVEMYNSVGTSRKKIEQTFERYRGEYARLRHALHTALPYRQYDEALRKLRHWRQKARETYRISMQRVNDEVLKYNVQSDQYLRLNVRAPGVAVRPVPFRIAEEMEKFDATFPEM
jgi:hypothetical protein